MASQSPHIIAGIDIGSTTTRVIITEHTGTDSLPRVIGIGKSETTGISKGYVVHEEEATRSLLSAVKLAETMAGVTIERSYVCINGISLETFHDTVTIPLNRQITEHDITYTASQINENFSKIYKNKFLLHTIPLTYYLDGKELFANPVGLIGSELTVEYSLVSCLAQHRESLINVVSRAEIDIVDIIASPAAAGVIALSKKSRIAGAALVDIGSETLSISVFEHDALVHTTVIPCGSNLITNDLAIGLQISLDEAEYVKSGKKMSKSSSQSIQKKRAQEIIEARIIDILNVIKKRLSLWKKDQLLPGGITLIGGGSQHENIDIYARNYLKLPVQLTQPSKLIPSKRELDTSWFAVYGICLLGDRQPQYRSTNIGFKKLFKDTKESLKNILEQFLP